jgi:hypothetical protein
MFSFWKIYSDVSWGMKKSLNSAETQKAHAIGMVLSQYAQDHGGKYPEGKSSTDVFQQLIDQKYLTDPTLLYVPLTGKHAANGMKLKPENVCWDVTDGVLPDDPATLPVVFLTGFKIRYGSDWNAFSLGYGPGTFIPVCTKECFAAFFRVDKDGIAQLFASSDYDGKRRVYRQLTPDGPLP